MTFLFYKFNINNTTINSYINWKNYKLHQQLVANTLYKTPHNNLIQEKILCSILGLQVYSDLWTSQTNQLTPSQLRPLQFRPLQFRPRQFRLLSIQTTLIQTPPDSDHPNSDPSRFRPP